MDINHTFTNIAGADMPYPTVNPSSTQKSVLIDEPHFEAQEIDDIIVRNGDEDFYYNLIIKLFYFAAAEFAIFLLLNIGWFFMCSIAIYDTETIIYRDAKEKKKRKKSKYTIVPEEEESVDRQESTAGLAINKVKNWLRFTRENKDFDIERGSARSGNRYFA